MNGGLSKLWIVLAAVFAAALVALVAQLLFILWRRRRSRFQTRIGPNEGQIPRSDHSFIDVDVDEVLKWQQGLYGVSSRVLFTIQEEEEREGLESSETTAYSSCAGKEGKTTKTMVVDVAVTVMRVEVEEATPPFLTPCDSPPYYTPSPSPSRDL